MYNNQSPQIVWRALFGAIIGITVGIGLFSYTLDLRESPGNSSIRGASIANVMRDGREYLENLFLADIYYKLSKISPDVTERKEFISDGLQSARHLVNLDSDDPHAIVLWFLLEKANLQETGGALSEKTLENLRERLTWLGEDHPYFYFSFAHRALGELYLGYGKKKEDVQRAAQHLEKAMTSFPYYPGNQVGHAEALLAQGQHQEARMWAESVLLALGPEYDPFEYSDWVERARKVWLETAKDLAE